MLGGMWRAAAAVAGVILAATALGGLIGGINFIGLFATALACVLSAALLLRYPRLRVPPVARLAHGPLAEVVANAELWLETRRTELPAAARRQVDSLGVRLDGLGLQLDHAEPPDDTADDVRRLVGVHLPAVVGGFTVAPRLPGDATALIDSLMRLGAEIDAITRRLASGMLHEGGRMVRVSHLGAGEPV